MFHHIQPECRFDLFTFNRERTFFFFFFVRALKCVRAVKRKDESELRNFSRGLFCDCPSVRAAVKSESAHSAQDAN